MTEEAWEYHMEFDTMDGRPVVVDYNSPSGGRILNLLKYRLTVNGQDYGIWPHGGPWNEDLLKIHVLQQLGTEEKTNP